MIFKGKHILIIGGTSGIGVAIVNMLLEEEAVFTITTRNLSKIPKHWGSVSINVIEADVANGDSVVHLVESINKVDGMVYTPGIVNLFLMVLFC